MVGKEVLIEYAKAIHDVRVAHPALGEEQPTLFFRLMMPWLIEPEGENRDQIAKRATAERQELVEWGFNGEKIAAEVRDIFAGDKHLAQCCGNPLALSYV